ncbi:hypothetical protein AEQ27_04280 [Frigoribacterium sp. RIT-PI-h]|nr:hypothetical protein AEQ27_04280 [Frigoribacterium sp. RIT-PI-h]
MDSERPYRGPIDGVMGPNSWLGVTARLKVGGYFEGPLSNANNAGSVFALQRWALDHNRPIGALNQWSKPTYRAVAWCLNRSF